MSDLTRFSVSVPNNLLQQFDKHVEENHYATRSKAIADLIANTLVKDKWSDNSDVAGAVVLVYDHHTKDVGHQLMELQHHFHHIVVSTQHVHLDHDNCLEIVVLKGKSTEVKELSSRLKACKGIKHASLVMTTTGKGL